jgi:hypothetical protein
MDEIRVCEDKVVSISHNALWDTFGVIAKPNREALTKIGFEKVLKLYYLPLKPMIPIDDRRLLEVTTNDHQRRN